MAETFYDGLTKLLCLLIHLGMVSSCKVVLRPQHGADSVQELRDELPFANGERILRGDIGVRRVV